MIDEKLIKRFREWRNENPNGRVSEFTKKDVKLPFEFGDRDRDGCREARWAEGNYRFVATIKPDYDNLDGVDCLGTFTDRGEWPETIKRGRVERNGYKRFKPEYSIRERQQDYVHRGYASGPAYAQAVEDARKDMRRAETCGDGWGFVSVKVEVFALTDTEVDEALGESTLRDVVNDSGDAYFVEIARDQALEALSEVRWNVHRACREYGQLHLPGVL